MRILDKIVNHLKIEIEILSESVPIFELEKTKGFERKCKSLKESKYLSDLKYSCIHFDRAISIYFMI